MHKHAALIKLWAEGVQIQREQSDGRWKTEANPTWKEEHNYRTLPVRFTIGCWYAVTFLDGTMAVGFSTGTYTLDINGEEYASTELLKAKEIENIVF